MARPKQMDIGAVLHAAYSRPNAGLDRVAARVRARLALMDTVGEAFRLLLEAPNSAMVATIGEQDWEKESAETENKNDDV